MEKAPQIISKEKPKDNSVEDILRQKGLETPKLSFHFYFNKHSTKEDATEVSEKIKDADIFN